jgi:nondiscriminating aspartyl-tRNA synthetase
MERIWSTQMSAHVGERVRLQGWLHRLRQLSNLSFLIVRDAQGLAQIVIEDPALIEQLATMHPETVLTITGTVVAEPQAPNGVEMHQPAIEVLAEAAEPPPFDLFRPTVKAQLPTFLDHAPILLRHPRQRALFRMAAASMAGFRTALMARDFVEIQTPKIVGAATEGGANVFKIDYFGQPAYLSQSPQLYKQIMVGVFERVFEIGPAFRAEPHDTPRHINEFVSLDVELGFIHDHTSVMEVLNRVLEGMIGAIHEQAADALTLLGTKRGAPLELPHVPQRIPVLHFADALDLYSHATGEDVRGEPDLAPTHERWLGEWARKEYGSDFLFVWGYPTAKRAFYTHPDPDRPGYSRGFDLLFRGLELVSGGQRLHRYADYLAVLNERRLNPASFEGYLEAFKHGMPPHGGFAIGLERWVARLVEAPNIRETTLFPRDLSRLTP